MAILRNAGNNSRVFIGVRVVVCELNVNSEFGNQGGELHVLV